MSECKGVMVFAEVDGGKLSTSAAELLGCGKMLADALKEDLYAVILGDNITDIAKSAVLPVIDRVYIAEDPLLKDYNNGLYVQATESVVKQISPRIILLGHTSIGSDLAPALAFRLETIATTDCVELAIDPETGQLLQTRPVYGGNALATFTSDRFPQIVTLRARVYPPAEMDNQKRGDLITIETEMGPPVVKIVEKVSRAAEGIKLEDAGVVIAGGRGIGSAEGFKQLDELAVLLNGAVGATRPPCDNGWVDGSAQIGLTGKIVAPELYLAIAISGSSQHISGCAGARNIVAINKDPEANIFKSAHYGIVGDWKKVLPAFTARIKELAGEKS